MKDVLIYTLDYCPYCKKAVSTLIDNRIKFHEVDSTHNEEEISKMLKNEYDIQGEVTYPQIIVNGVRFGGNDSLQESIRNGDFEKIFR